MNITITPQFLLQQLAQIQHLERGKLCIIRQGPNGPYYVNGAAATNACGTESDSEED